MNIAIIGAGLSGANIYSLLKKDYMEKSLDNIFVFGDVHECYYPLMSLIDQFPKYSELIFEGEIYNIEGE